MLREFTSSNFCVHVGGFAAWHAERFPLSGFCESEMLGEKQNLADVMGIMRDLAVDGLHHGVRLGANRHRSREVGLRERFERIEDIFPAAFPLFDQFGACGGRSFKLRVAVAIWFLAIGSKEIEPANAYCPTNVSR